MLKDAKKREGSRGEVNASGRRGEFRRQPAERVLRHRRVNQRPTGIDTGTGDPDQRLTATTVDPSGIDTGTGDPDQKGV